MNTLWTEGLTTMVIGMGVVFSFLITTIFSMLVMSKVVAYLNKIFPEASSQPVAIKKATTDDTDIAVAIAAAIARK